MGRRPNARAHRVFKPPVQVLAHGWGRRCNQKTLMARPERSCKLALYFRASITVERLPLSALDGGNANPEAVLATIERTFTVSASFHCSCRECRHGSVDALNVKSLIRGAGVLHRCWQTPDDAPC